MSEKKYIVVDYMQKDVHTIPEHSSLKDAVRVMLKEHTNGLVVVDSNHHVVGMLSSWDIIQYIVPDYLEKDKHLASFESGDFFAQRIEQLANDPIEKFSTKQVHATKMSHTLMEAATLLSEFNIRQLPVTDDTGKLVGYLNRTDMKKAIGEVLGLDSKS